MQRISGEREYGPEFDDRLINLVRVNPAIYDVNHPNYRRNPVRIAIWDRIAAELGATSRFLQTKWKNIRYNYLQEIKCLETGTTNANVRKRRFTEDLSFLQKTAQTYNVKKSFGTTEKIRPKNPSSDNSSDNEESNSYISSSKAPHSYEVIEIGDDDDDASHDFELHEMRNGKAAADRVNFTTREKADEKDLDKCGNYLEPPLSPLLTPLVIMGHTENNHKQQHSGDDNARNGGAASEVTIEPIAKMKMASQRHSSLSRVGSPTPAKHNCASLSMPVNDPIELYCLSLADNFRAMERKERERVKFEIAKILKDARYNDS